MNSVSYDLILVEDRQRKEITPKELLELKRSILSKGLLHPPVLSYPGPGYKLIAGERRLRAMIQLHEEGLVFSYNSEPVPAGHIPYSLISDLTPADLQEAELEENVLRMPLTWLEEAEAKAKIHEMRTEKAKAEGLPAPTLKSTAQYITEKTQADPEKPSRSVNAEQAALTRAITVAKHKDNPAVQKAKNLTQAYAAILDQTETQFKAILASRSAEGQSNLQLLKGDCLEILPTLKANTFDIIYGDPPYGIGADTMKSDSKHFYQDDPEYALRIYQAIITEGFRVTKQRAAMFLWCDIDHFVRIRDLCAMGGWVPWRTPIIWYKGESGYAPWGRAGFVRTYEILLYAVKGQRELFSPGGPDVSIRRTASASKRVHAAEKPIDVLEYYLSRAALEGDSVLDPCCGSGPIFEAGHNLKLKVTGIEVSQQYQELALARIGDVLNGKGKDQDGEGEPEELELDDELDLNGEENSISSSPSFP